MLNTARYVLVTALCVLALACGSKEENKPQEAPKSAEPAKEQPAQPAAQPEAVADPNAADPAAAEAAAQPSGLVPDLQKLADKACACKDKACANAVQDEVAKLMAEAKQPPAGETQTIANTMQKLQGCVAQAQQK